MGNQIKLTDLEQFIEACYLLTTKGARYEACGETLTIYITGY